MLYMPIACPGSGKSYLADRMVEAGIIDVDAVVSPDRYREILSGERANQDVNSAVFRIVDEIVLYRVKYDLDIYLDGTNLHQKSRTSILNRVRSVYEANHGLGNVQPLTILLSDAPRSLVEQRNRDRAHPVPEGPWESLWDRSEALDVKPLVEGYGATIVTFEEMLEKCDETI